MEDPKPTVRAVSLPMVVQAINQSKNKLDKHELEVLGPVEYVWGQSLSTQLHREAGQNVKCRVLTMLFRRFPSSGYVYAPTEVCSKSLTMAAIEAVRKKPTSSLSKEDWPKGGTLPSKKPKPKPKKKGGLHSVQLSPTLCEGQLKTCGCKLRMRARSCGCGQRPDHAHGNHCNTFKHCW